MLSVYAEVYKFPDLVTRGHVWVMDTCQWQLIAPFFIRYNIWYGILVVAASIADWKSTCCFRVTCRIQAALQYL